ncbi:MAG TPA: DEAD/DEAH box helicase, partial [Gemmatimonadaceae bacterium]
MPPRTPRADPALRPFHPVVRRWFAETLGRPSEPQRQGWPVIATGAHTLVLAPTGTGKTLAAFLWELNALLVDGLDAPLANAVHILYVSPLKALNNDVQRNLERPLAELRARFEGAGHGFPEIRVAVRTGDTPSSARQRMLRKAPHILITTPESLHILLTSVKARGMFSALRAVILDEIHAVAGTKRGAHLALTLERLEAQCERPPQRIGLSATQRPLGEIGRFLGGLDGGARPSALGTRREDSSAPAERPAPRAEGQPFAAPTRFRPVSIVDCGLVKAMETTVVSPVEDLGDVGGTVWPKVVRVVLEQIRSARTTLVFVNNRAQAERIAARVNAEAGEELALPYHGSLARERRFLLEERLKAGELRALVTTSSLELGIDVGSVDLVVQLQSPKRVASALQRVGRAGHQLGAVSRGVLVPTFRDDGMEILAIARGMLEGDVEPTRVVQNALDVLAQVIVAAVSIEEWTSADLFALVRRAYPYHRLTRGAFDEVLAMLSGKYPADLAAELEARLSWDRTTDRLTGSRSSRMTAVISGGTIPDRGLYTVHLPDRTRLGELDEEFVHESRIGDVFQLGSSTWRIGAIEHDRVVVTPAPGAPARMPFWHGEFMARSSHLAPRVGALRRELDAARTLEDLAAIRREYYCDEATARSLVEYVQAQRAITGRVPDDRTLVVEHFRDELGGVRIVLHAPFGGRVTAPWGMALAQRVRESLNGMDVQVQTTDDGLMLRLPDLGAEPPLAALMGLSPEEAERRVLAEVGTSSLFGARFRMNAARALLLPRGSAKRRMPLWLQRLKALDLLQAVQEYPEFPILVETYRDVLQDGFDMPALKEVLAAIADGRIGVRTARTELPSPFAASLQFGFVIDWLYGDDTPRAERRAAVLSLDQHLLEEIMGSEGADEGTLEALADVVARRRGTSPKRRARDADELAVLLDRAGDLALAELRERVAPPGEGGRGDPVHELLERGRAIVVRIPTAAGDAERVILTESYPRYLAAFGEAPLATVRAGGSLDPRPAADVVPEPLRHATLTRTAARRELVARLVALSAPLSVDDVLRRYALPARGVEQLLEEWRAAGRLVRGSFGTSETRWVSKRLVEQARRIELARARRAIQAVPLAVYVAFLQRWQHLDPRTRLRGAADGSAVALRQLLGLSRPPEAWERDLLPARVVDHDAEALSRLTGSGAIVWVGDGRRDEESGAWRLVGVRWLERGAARVWLGDDDGEPPLGEHASRVLAILREQGASFLAELQSATTLGPHALRDALRELVAAGLVTNDTVDALRAVAAFRSPLPIPRPGEPDPTRWLPADFTASRPVVQRRPNLRRLPKWRRPDAPGGLEERWGGRWSLVRRPGTLGPALDEEARGEAVARAWLERYGIVSRDWWRRERPPVSWRAIYRELRRLELRGEVRRGYFVEGLAGAQFALPAAVELLRDSAEDREAPVIAMGVADPANAWILPLPGIARDPLHRPRGRGAVLVTRAGRVLLAAESRGARVSVAPGLDEHDVAEAAAALAERLLGRAVGRRRDLLVETIDGVRAATSPH